MNLRTVEIFCEVISRRSFSRAAEAYNVSQSLASQAVILLEERLGTQLVDRSRRPFEVTAAGQLYYEGCLQWLKDLRCLEDRVQKVNHRVSGRLRVAALYSSGLLRMAQYVQSFRDAWPEVEFTLEYLRPAEVYDRVATEECDLGIVSFPRDNNEFACIPWQNQELVLVTAARDERAHMKSISVRDLEGCDFIGFTPDLSIRKKIDRWLKQERVNVRVIQEFDNIEVVKRSVEIGSGAAILPRATVAREVDYGALSAIELSDVDWHRPLGIVHRRNRTLTSAAEKFVELLHEPQPAELTRVNDQALDDTAIEFSSHHEKRVKEKKSANTHKA